MTTHPDTDEHVAGCAECRARVAPAASDVDLGRAWQGVAAEVWARPVGWLEQAIGRLLRSPGLARALLTTPSLVASWLLASATVLAVGVAATRDSGEPWFALAAPALTGIGIAYAYGPGVDPAFELSRTMAVSDRMVLLARVLAVFGINALFGLAATLVVADAAGLTLGWLLPMAAVSALALAVSTLVRSAIVGAGAALSAWALIVLGSAVGTDNLTSAAHPGDLAPLYLLATLVCGALALVATSHPRIGSWQWR